MLGIKKYKNQNSGMTYIELAVVMGIFATLSMLSLFNFGVFQAKVDIKNLASDIALRLLDSQKSSLSGKLPPSTQRALIPIGNLATWKPAYGLYFDLTQPNSFISYVDADADSSYTGTTSCTSECLEKVTITKGNTVKRFETYVGGTATSFGGPLSVSFKRPNSNAIFKAGATDFTGVEYVQVVIDSPKSTSGTSLEAGIKIYPSGRIQIN